MYFGSKNIETKSSCSHELTSFLKYHMPLSPLGFLSGQSVIIFCIE